MVLLVLGGVGVVLLVLGGRVVLLVWFYWC